MCVCVGRRRGGGGGGGRCVAQRDFTRYFTREFPNIIPPPPPPPPLGHTIHIHR